MDFDWGNEFVKDKSSQANQMCYRTRRFLGVKKEAVVII